MEEASAERRGEERKGNQRKTWLVTLLNSRTYVACQTRTASSFVHRGRAAASHDALVRSQRCQAVSPPRRWNFRGHFHWVICLSTPAPPCGQKLHERRAESYEVMMRALGAPAKGASMHFVVAAQHARSSHTPFAHLLSIDSTHVSTLFLRHPLHRSI